MANNVGKIMYWANIRLVSWRTQGYWALSWQTAEQRSVGFYTDTKDPNKAKEIVLRLAEKLPRNMANGNESYWTVDGVWQVRYPDEYEFAKQDMLT